jgi:bifunctional non-homologous end joining protein LigD
VTLVRYPDGVTGEHFYEKDAPSYTPKWVSTCNVPRRGGGPDIRYILVNDRRTLVWLANLATLELHPFLHRAPEIDCPTQVVFDLDPGEGADILACAEIALHLREALQAMELESFAKVSGSKGIQVYVPLNTPVSYAQTQPFAKALAQLLEQQHPARVVSEMPKHLRAGKVFIDWSQNSDFKTTVGVYSLRAKRHHPFVSMPVRWQELETANEISDLTFTPEQALARIDEVGDLFQPVLELQQRLPGSGARPVAAKRNRQPPAPTPLVKSSRQGSRRRFVIQLHAASHLHYDFRLEMHGVLKSWAVPKGVPFRPGEHRLAAATEDHPLEYIDFEGTIPKGQYGGGTVLVWDTGTWELIEGNYYKGHLQFHLSGEKLKGEYRLEKKDEKNWRLQRLSDAGDEPHARSVLTDRTLDEVAATAGAQWQSNRTRAGIDLDTLPRADIEFVEPMQAKAAEHLPARDGWLYEVKLDGYRTLALRTADGVRLLSRNNNPQNERFPSVAKAMEDAEPGTVLDGEVVALNDHGRPSFHVLQNKLTRKTTLLYYVFDLLAYRGRDTTKLPLRERRRLLELDAMQPMSAPVLLSTTLDADPDRLIEAATEQGLEGIVAKRESSVYETGKRTGAWVKVRAAKGQELVIGGYKPGTHVFDYLLAGYYSGERLLFIAKLKNGFTPKLRRAVAARFADLQTGECPFDNVPEPKNARRGEAITAAVMKSLRWLRPELVAQVEFVDWTDADHLRHARFIALRDDKDPRTVVKEI